MHLMKGFVVRIGDLDLCIGRPESTGTLRCQLRLHWMQATPKRVRNEIDEADLVISMLPAFLHPEVAADAIATRTPLITPSYLSPEIAAMDQAAKDAGIPIFNELGLDPGIDHLSAMQVIDELRSRGVEIDWF